MQKLLSIALVLFLGTALLAGCDSFVEEVDLPIDTVDDFQLDEEAQIPFLITGVQGRFSTTHDQLALLSDGLSDQFIFDQRVPRATFPSYREIDEGDITFANNSVDAVYNDLGELRKFADDLLRRVDAITFEDADLERTARFTANFYGGVARYFYATYIALEPRVGGGVIDAGPFIPSAQMYADAIDKLNTALQFADAYQTRVINTLIARIQLYQGNFAAAGQAAANGLQDGDPDFASLHNVESTNLYWTQAGIGRNQWVVSFDLAAVVDSDPAEAVRIPLTAIAGTDNPPTTFFRQAKYNVEGAPLPFATWQENELILAEVEIRNGGGDPLARINAVRASHGLDPLGAADLGTLQFEREKELFATGLRLPDQRRFDTWHLGPSTWQFLPITQSERNQNDNI